MLNQAWLCVREGHWCGERAPSALLAHSEQKQLTQTSSSSQVKVTVLL